MTQAQHTASNPFYNVWVGASAGTGKTKVLSDRVLRLLLEGVEADKILCLTFTNAAAAEMASRVSQRLGQWVVWDDDRLDKELTALHGTTNDALRSYARGLFATIVDAGDRLNIQTIHSFCQQLMRRFPLEADIAPHFKVIDEQTSDGLIHEAWLRLLNEAEQELPNLNQAISHLARWCPEMSIRNLVKEVVGNRGKLKTLTHHYGSLESLIEATYEQLDVSRNASEEQVIADACSDASFDRNALQSACEVLLQSPKPTSVKTGQGIAEWLAGDDVYRKMHLHRYSEFFLTQKREPIKRLATQDCSLALPALEKEQERMLRLDQTLKSLRIAYKTENLLIVAGALLELYESEKRLRGFLDYQDLIDRSSALLHASDMTPWVLFKIDGGIDHILVDEAQDTSPIQWQLIEALTEEFFVGDGARTTHRTLFVVGDEKQSIFSFNGADPNGFDRMRQFFGQKATSAGLAWQPITLDISFRSTHAVLHLVDTLFSNAAHHHAISSQQEPITHNPFRNQHFGCVELWPLIEKPESEELEPWALPSVQQEDESAEARMAQKIADTIDQWLTTKRILKGKGRAIEAGDIMILLRSRRNLLKRIVKALKAKHIPVAGEDKMVLTEHLAIMDLMALGRFLLLPEDDLNLATLLKSPFIGLDEDQLMHLCTQRESRSLWHHLTQQQATIYQKARDYLATLLSKTDYISPFALFSLVLEEYGGRKQLVSRLGEETHDPVNAFLAMAAEYERTYSPSLQGFLQWLESGSAEIKRDLGQGNAQIRIMTVHSAKGLQAPVVILPDTMTASNDKDALIWQENEAPLMLWTDGADNRNTLCHALKDHEKQQRLAEEKRLLYVALTRAEDELYIAGYDGGKRSKDPKWYELIHEAMQSIATKTDDGVLRYESGTAVANTGTTEIIPKVPEIIASPDFIDQPPQPEPSPSLPLSPSRLEEVEPAMLSPKQQQSILKGNIIHKLLELLPHVEQSERLEKAKRYLAHFAHDLDASEQQEMITQCQNILSDPQFSYVFSEHSRAEVPLVGVVGNHVVSGQIDRLVVTEDKVFIIDYKTGYHIPETQADIPKRHIKQMDLYKQLLAQIYPNKAIKCALIWTQAPLLMPLDM